jgi:hypothetical protein
VRELVLGSEAVTFDGTVVELFHEGVQDTIRIHVRFLSVHANPKRDGAVRYTFAPGPDPYNGFHITVPPERDAEARAFLDAVGAAKRAALGG